MNGEPLADPASLLEENILAGRLLDAWQEFSPLLDAPGGPPPGMTAFQLGRLMILLGAPRRGRALQIRNYRANRADPRHFYHSLNLRAAWVPMGALAREAADLLEKQADLGRGLRADLLAFQAWVAAEQRDATTAKHHIEAALALHEDDSWLWVVRSECHAAADEYAAALEASRRAVALAPRYRAAVQRHTEALVHLGRDDEALDFLLEAHETSQQAALALILQIHFSEREDHSRALWCLDEVERLSPIMEPALADWLRTRRADFHLMAGNLAAFREQAAGAKSGFHRKAADFLESAEAAHGKRVRLAVPFVRQHRSTCAPSTLSALAAFWGRNIDHLEIAAAICHEGTPWHKERKWAHENGFVTREFRVTWDSLRALIDRGLPFTLTTQWATGAHLQACIGYDSRIGSAILRDPTERHFGEVSLEALAAEHPIDGPRGLVLVPQEQAALLDGLHLPDTAAYDAYHDLLVAMETHDRLAIAAALSGLRSVAPGRRLTRDGELSAAMALGDHARALAAVESLLEEIPWHPPLALLKGSLLARLRRSKERRDWLEQAVGRPRSAPVFRSELGEELLEDARELVLADHHLRRALLRQPGEARAHESLGRCRMKQRRHEEAAACRRAAACLAPAFEPYAWGYFEVCQILGRSREVLDFLAERTARQGGKSHGPWISHARALDALNRPEEAAAVLENAAKHLPDDGALRLHGGRLMLFWGPDFRRQGLERIEQARGRVPEAQWLSEAASAASLCGQRRSAIRHARTLAKLQPHDIGNWRMLCRLVAEEENAGAAIALLEQALAEHPNHSDLWALLAEWQVASPQGPLAALDRHLALEPTSRWGLRERALRRLDPKPDPAALDDARAALELDPLDAASHSVLGLVLVRLDRKQEAADSFRQAVRLDIDHSSASEEWMALASDAASAVEILGCIDTEMRRQVSDGSIVLPYQRLAWRWIDPETLAGQLQGWREERPDLWQTHSALIDHRLRMGQAEQALEAAGRMVETFPLMPRAWIDCAKARHAAGLLEQAAEATARALEISPTWDEAARCHAEALERIGREREAEQVLRTACQNEPLNSANHGCLAEVIRRAGRPREAFDLLRAALRECWAYAWGWTSVAEWAREHGWQEEILADLSAMSSRRGHLHRWWCIAAETFAALGHSRESMEAIRRAIDLKPEDTEGRDQLAWLLAREQRWDEAVAALDLPEDPSLAPVEIQGRHAWICMRMGRPEEAIRRMKDLLGREPGYAWGHAELCNWLAERQDWQGVREHARNWTRHAPQDARAFARLAEAEEHLDAENAAAEAYQKAWQLQPDYAFPGRKWLEALMKQRRFAEAETTLQRLQYYTPSIGIRCDAVELALRRERFDDALKQAEALLDDPQAGLGDLRWMDSLFESHGISNRWKTKVAQRVLQDEPHSPAAVALWIGHLPPVDQTGKGRRRILRLPLDSPARILAWQRWIELLSGRGDGKLLHDMVRRHADEFRRHAALWKETGGAYLSVGRSVEGIRWLEDWPTRPDDLDCMVLVWFASLCDAAEGKNPRWRAAAAQARAEAITRFPADPSISAVLAGQAFHHAEAGESPQASRLLEHFEESRTSDFYIHYARLARAILAASDGREDEARQHLDSAAEYFRSLTGPIADHLVRRACRAVARVVPWAAGSPRKLCRRWQISQPNFWFVTFHQTKPRTFYATVAVIAVLVSILKDCSDS